MWRLAVLLALAAPAVWSQAFPFRLTVTQGVNSQNIANGGTVVMSAPIGQTEIVSLRVVYLGTGVVTVSQPPLVLGAGFQAAIEGSLPLTINPGGTFDVEITFAPLAVQSTSQLTLPVVETLPPAAGSANPTVTTYQVALSLQGTAPSFLFSYILQTDENVVPLQPGGEIQFLPTLVGSTAQAALNITNAGTGSGVVTKIAYSGSSSFRLQRIPLLPVTVVSNQNVQLLLLYTPPDELPDTGQVTIGFSTGQEVTFSVTGTGIAPKLDYQILGADPPVSVPPGGTIQLPSSEVGETSNLTLRILNQGTAPATLTAITVLGPGFALGSVVTLPRTLAPGESLVFTLAFTPSRPGDLTGSLIVNSDVFTLAGTGLGPLLTFSYQAGGTTITLGTQNPAVVFSPVRITETAELVLTVRNTGSVAAPVSGLGVIPANGAFAVSGLPGLPLALAPGASFEVRISFAPTVIGIANGTLQLNSIAIPLTGAATDPPALPAYTIEGIPATATPLTQPGVRLRLASPYPVAISGSLTMGVSAGELAADPAVQFSTGGRTASFVIPANQTDAVFSTQGTQIGVQTGTVASTVTLTPIFATQAGNVDLTPSSPATLRFTINPAAPAIIAVQVLSPTADTLSIQITGFTTTRSLSEAKISFTVAKDFSMPVTEFTIDVSQVSRAWFQTLASQAFGGQFRLTIPFVFRGLPSGRTLLESIESIGVTASNASGSSSPAQTSLR